MATTWINRGHLYAPHVTPVIADVNFIVAPANTGGLGVTNVNGQAVANVFMNTTATPGKGPNGQLNPNPAAGNILIQMADNYTRLYSMSATFQSPLSGTNLAVNATALTVGAAYVISVLGTSTAADWLALGVPSGVTPAVGVSFIAKVTGSGSGSGQVQVPATAGSNIDHLEIVGTPQLSLGPNPLGPSPNVGGWILLSAQKANALTAPATGTRIYIEMYLNQSSVTVDND